MKSLFSAILVQKNDHDTNVHSIVCASIGARATASCIWDFTWLVFANRELGQLFGSQLTYRSLLFSIKIDLLLHIMENTDTGTSAANENI